MKSLKATLAAARTIDDLLVVSGQAEAVRYAMQVRGDSLEAMNDAAETKLRAERKLGRFSQRPSGRLRDVREGRRRDFDHQEG